MTADFDTWWNQDTQTPGNPHPPGQPAYWGLHGHLPIDRFEGSKT